MISLGAARVGSQTSGMGKSLKLSVYAVPRDRDLLGLSLTLTRGTQPIETYVQCTYLHLTELSVDMYLIPGTGYMIPDTCT